jgi:hypothetical protein
MQISTGILLLRLAVLSSRVIHVLLLALLLLLLLLLLLRPVWRLAHR